MRCLHSVRRVAGRDRLVACATHNGFLRQALMKCRHSGGVKTAPLPDSYIGAHAEVESHTLVARDGARYRSYFPKVTVVAP